MWGGIRSWVVSEELRGQWLCEEESWVERSVTMWGGITSWEVSDYVRRNKELRGLWLCKESGAERSVWLCEEESGAVRSVRNQELWGQWWGIRSCEVSDYVRKNQELWGHCDCVMRNQELRGQYDYVRRLNIDRDDPPYQYHNSWGNPVSLWYHLANVNWVKK